MEFRLLRALVRRVRLMREYWYDYGRMVRCSSAVNRGDTREKLRALITIRYHGIEKGLSLPQPRGGFGREKVKDLLEMLRTYVREYGADHTIATALNALRAYLEFNDRVGTKNDVLREQVNELACDGAVSEATDPGTFAGCTTVARSEVMDGTRAPFERFAQLRYSVRQFSTDPVDRKTIHGVVQVALKTPSVCNRQPWKVWVVDDPSGVRQVLEIGGGARGFEDQVHTLLVVTTDLACFLSPGERNQCWIDGGMFGMSLMYALHARGLVSCCMNWSKTHDSDLRLRRLMGIPEAESVIFLLAVGHPREQFVVATSTRRPLKDVVRHWPDTKEQQADPGPCQEVARSVASRGRT